MLKRCAFTSLTVFVVRKHAPG